MSPLAMAFPSPTQVLASKHAEQSYIERQESAAANINAQHASRGQNAILAEQLRALLTYRHTRRSKLLQLGCKNILASARAALDMHFRSPHCIWRPTPNHPPFSTFQTLPCWTKTYCGAPFPVCTPYDRTRTALQSQLSVPCSVTLQPTQTLPCYKEKHSARAAACMCVAG